MKTGNNVRFGQKEVFGYCSVSLIEKKKLDFC